MTAMKKAMNDAGIRGAAERLIAEEDLIVAKVGPYRPVALLEFQSMLQRNPELMWEVFADVRDRITERRIVAAYERQAKKSRKEIRSVGHLQSGRQTCLAPRPTARLDFNAQRRALAPIVRTILDTMMTPLGRAIGDITGSEAKGLHARTRREMKIYAYVASHTPPDELVKDFVKAKDLEAIARAAEKENDNA